MTNESAQPSPSPIGSVAPLEYQTWRPALRTLIERMVQFGVRVGAESVAGEPWPAEVWQRAEAQTDVVEAIQALVTDVCVARDAQWRAVRNEKSAAGLPAPCFFATMDYIPDKCTGATYQCFYCKKWWCDEHAGGHFESDKHTESAAGLNDSLQPSESDLSHHVVGSNEPSTHEPFRESSEVRGA